MTSRKTPLSPVVSFPMQDSLELLLEQEPNEILPHDHPPGGGGVPKGEGFVFHDNHGRNVEILGDRTVARRVASYNQGVVLVQPPLQPGRMVEVVVEQVDTRWQSSLMVGVVLVPPERLSLPVTALGFKSPSYVVANDYVSIGGRKVRCCLQLSCFKVDLSTSRFYFSCFEVLQVSQIRFIKCFKILQDYLYCTPVNLKYFSQLKLCMKYFKVLQNYLSCASVTLKYFK